jgi:hypothetical protein
LPPRGLNSTSCPGSERCFARAAVDVLAVGDAVHKGGVVALAVPITAE